MINLPRRFLTLSLTLTCVPLLLVALFSPSRRPLQAFSSGAVGYHGGSGVTCGGCHRGGIAPTAMLTGTTTLSADTLGEYILSIQSSAPLSQTHAGFNVAILDSNKQAVGTLIATDDTTKLQFGELTHTAPKENDATGQTSFAFSWQAPPRAGSYTLYFAANSVNNNHSSSGDAPHLGTLIITVEAGPSHQLYLPLVARNE